MEQFINKVICSDCLEVMKDIPDNSVDSIVTDPPYELGFMGKKWDNSGIAYNVEMWKECLRVLKPGGHLLSFGGTRTYHRMAVAIEDAGFEVRDMIEWVYGSGFPKSLNIGKAVDKLQGNEREVLPPKTFPDGSKDRKTANHKFYADEEEQENNYTNTKGTSEWEGWGTALKPSHEPICMARKPLGYWETKNTLTAKERDEFQDLWDKMEAGMPYDEKRYEELWAKKEVKVFKSLSVAENCLKYGTGGINIDESRVEFEDTPNPATNPLYRYKNDYKQVTDNGQHEGVNVKFTNSLNPPSELGRFPANLIHDNSEEVRECFPETGVSKGGQSGVKKSGLTYSANWDEKNNTKGCGFGDSGNASRFFKSIIYQAKASKSERNKGCEGLDEKAKVFNGQSDKPSEDMKDVEKRFTTQPKANNHPTVKPIALMEYLIKMVTHKGGIVLDPFAGSGSTLVAAKQNGYQYIGIELTEEYIPIINARLTQDTNPKE